MGFPLGSRLSYSLGRRYGSLDNDEMLEWFNIGEITTHSNRFEEGVLIWWTR